MTILAIFTVLITAYAIIITAYLNHVKTKYNKNIDALYDVSELLVDRLNSSTELIKELDSENEHLKSILNEIESGNPNVKRIVIDGSNISKTEEEIGNIIMKSLKDMRDKAYNNVMSNIDERTKTVLDNVILWDMSHCLDKKTNKRFFNTTYANKEAIVVEEDCNVTIEHPLTKEDVKLDLCIRFEDDTQIYVPSIAVKLKD